MNDYEGEGRKYNSEKQEKEEEREKDKKRECVSS
jgi:hypothetical protein